MKGKPIWALGLMSGTSLDGVDAALLQTDGEQVISHGPCLTLPYTPDVQTRMRTLLDEAQGLAAAGPLPAAFAAAERELTLHHADAVHAVLAKAAMPAHEVQVIGFHGQTILHRPQRRQTVQLGSGALLANLTRIDVINDFRVADVQAGGQGAPLVPYYHRALVAAAKRPGPVAVVNIGGVANVTYIGPEGDLLAFDTGPGNGLIDDWVRRHTGAALDLDGRLAASGRVDRDRLDRAMAQDWFARPAPKSLDRLDFSLAMVEGLSPGNGAATLTALTAEALAASIALMPSRPEEWIICGGGRHNPELMKALIQRLGNRVTTAEEAGWRGDALEAEAFAFLAVRALNGWDLSGPTTTGVPRPLTGGVFHPADRQQS